MRHKLFLSLMGLGLVVMLGAAPPQASKKTASAKPATKPAAAESGAEKSAFNKEYMASYIRHLYGWAAQVNIEIGEFTPAPIAGLKQTTIKASYGPASEEKTFYISGDGKYILDGAMYAAADNPYRANLNKITTALQPSFGAAGASVVIVAYSDFQCPHCRDEAKSLRQNVAKTYPNDVRVYFKDYPLPNHDWATTAAIAGRCIFRQNPVAFWDYHDWIFDKQGEITVANFKEKLGEFIKGKEIDPLQLNRCVDKKETESEVAKSIGEGKSLAVSSTPTMFLNGRKLQGSMDWIRLKQLIDLEIEYQKKTQDAGEECCTVKLPSPVPNQ